MNTAIWWIRRDMRLADNQALAAALAQSGRVLPVFILDPALVNSPWVGERRLAFLLAGLRALDADLRSRGSCLVFLNGDPVQVLPGLFRRVGAVGVHAEQDVSPFACHRDEQVGRQVPLHLAGGGSFLPPGSILKKDGNPYTVFTPFSRAWRQQAKARQPLPAPARIAPEEGVVGDPIPYNPPHLLEELFPAGEREGLRRLEAFTQSPIGQYHQQRDRMDLAGTSSLSPYLRFGMISIRQAVCAAERAARLLAGSGDEQGPETWLNELIWREFYQSILFHFPNVRRESFKPTLRAVPWRNDPVELEAWQQGRTGYPVVDAGMRQLRMEGWMHNRARMITASFLVKDLLVDWRLGERWFMQHLMDGDPASNNGGWQWTAGTGTDAAPYFRIFNPTLQGVKFDPAGRYIRRHVPELSGLPEEFIHQPWKMSRHQQQQFGCIIGKDYPAPIVDHAVARGRLLAAYRQERFG